jgi:hypothetical protein
MAKRTLAQQLASEIVDFKCNQHIKDGRFLNGSLVLEFSDGSKTRIPASGFYNQNPGTWEDGTPKYPVCGKMDHYKIQRQMGYREQLQGESLLDNPHLVERYRKEAEFANRDAVHTDTRPDERSEAEHDEKLKAKRQPRKAKAA